MCSIFFIFDSFASLHFSLVKLVLFSISKGFTTNFSLSGLVAATAGGIQVYMLPGVADTLWEMLEFNRQV